MKIAEMDKLEIGDKVEVRRYDTTKECYEWVPGTVSRILVCTDGRRFLHGGYHSVWAEVNGLQECLDAELTRRVEEN